MIFLRMRKQASSRTNGNVSDDALLDVSDACSHGGVMRVISALAIGSVGVNDVYEGTPLFMIAFKKVIYTHKRSISL